LAIVGTLLAIVVDVGVVAALRMPGHSAGGALPTGTAPPASSSVSAAAHRPAPSPPPDKQVSAAAEDAEDAIARLIATQPAGSVSAATVNMATGARDAAGAGAGMWTASAYKLLVLEALLLEGQDGRTTLSAAQAARATAMIEASDNKAGYSLFLDAGGKVGMSAAARRFEMSHTAPGRGDPTFTTTSARDCVVLLENLVRGGPLNADSRSFALDLMRRVDADQRWGVGVIADPGTTFANKNGWLAVDDTNGPGQTDGGRWIVNSLGIVTVHGQQILMAILTQHQPSLQAGIDLVEALARAMPPTLARDS